MSYCISATSRQHAMYAMIPTDTFHVFSSGATASQSAITSASVSPLKVCTHRLTKSCRFHCSVLLCGLFSTLCRAASRLTKGLLHVSQSRLDEAFQALKIVLISRTYDTAEQSRLATFHVKCDGTTGKCLHPSAHLTTHILYIHTLMQHMPIGYTELHQPYFSTCTSNRAC